ncbi:MAG: DEAD/DEAH box helicase [Deltaproteobacteria bacterium]|nr:DEAD/DEAH box helicase [Deltaproteobacteria bacterium]
MNASDLPNADPRFDDLDLIPPLLDALRREGYTRPTPIQVRAIPPALAGRDVMGCAQTGTGKTAAFALPILQHLAKVPPRRGRGVRALVLTPTRELAAQVGESFTTYGALTRIRTTVIFGGVGQRPQEEALQRNPQVLVATPGRLLDLMQQGLLSLEAVEVFVLDEADRMLDMGFIHDIRRVVKALPSERQTLFFSATLPEEITGLAGTMLTDPVRVAVDPPASTVDRIRQGLCFVEKADKAELLLLVLAAREMTRVLVFTRTKHGADKVVRRLVKGGVRALAIHGNKSQGARTRAMDAFRGGETRVLVATDIAARGIDVEEVSHVVNYDLPHEPEVYVHRIGRTARAGEDGVALSFCMEEERADLAAIERLIGRHLDRLDDHPFRSPLPAPPLTPLGRAPRGPGRPAGRPAGHPLGGRAGDRASGGGRGAPRRDRRRGASGR